MSAGRALVSGRECRCKPVSDEHDEGHAIAQFVRSRTRARSIGSGELVEKPVRGRAKALLMFLPERRPSG